MKLKCNQYTIELLYNDLIIIKLTTNFNLQQHWKQEIALNEENAHTHNNDREPLHDIKKVAEKAQMKNSGLTYVSEKCLQLTWATVLGGWD